MAEETLVTSFLSEEKIQAGVALVEGLDKRNILVSGAFWFFVPEIGSWRLIIASPSVSVEGPKKIYQKIQSTLHRMDEPKPELAEISVLSPKDPLIALIRLLVRTGPMSRLRVSRSSVNGVFIHDALIYRMN